MTGLFTRHPASVGETYGEHLGNAARFGVMLMAGGTACLVHAVLPFLFTATGSTMVNRLHGEMMARRRSGGANVAPLKGNAALPHRSD